MSFAFISLDDTADVGIHVLTRCTKCHVFVSYLDEVLDVGRF